MDKTEDATTPITRLLIAILGRRHSLHRLHVFARIFAQIGKGFPGLRNSVSPANTRRTTRYKLTFSDIKQTKSSTALTSRRRSRSRSSWAWAWQRRYASTRVV